MGRLVFSEGQIPAQAPCRIYSVPTLGYDISVPWAIRKPASVLIETSEWSGYGIHTGRAFEVASIRIGGLPLFMQDYWIQKTIKSYQEIAPGFHSYGGLTLEADGWNLQLKESPETSQGDTHYYVGLILRQDNMPFSIQELEEFLEITELFLSVITSQNKQFDWAVAFQVQDNPTDQRLRIVKAQNHYLPIPPLDPTTAQLEPWLNLFSKFYSACREQETGPMLLEAIKR